MNVKKFRQTQINQAPEDRNKERKKERHSELCRRRKEIRLSLSMEQSQILSDAGDNFTIDYIFV